MSAQVQELTGSPEEAVLYACILDPTNVDLVGLTPEHFLEARCRMAWRALVALVQREVPADPFTIPDEATEDPVARGQMSRWLQSLVADTPAGWRHNAEHWAGILRRRYRHDQTRLQLAEAMDKLKQGDHLTDEVIDSVVKGLAALDTGTDCDALTARELMQQRIGEYLRAHEAFERGESLMSGVPTGLPWLDRTMGGYQRGIASILAARSGMGKSTAALLACIAAHGAGHGVHVFSMEDQRRNYADRLIAHETGISAEVLRSGLIPRGDFALVKRAAREISERKRWLVDDRSGLTAQEIVRQVRRHKRQNQTALVVVDYLQHIKRPRRRQDHEEYAEIMQWFSDAAKADDVAYLVLCQLTKAHSQRTDKYPVRSDLRGGGELDEKAKCIVFLYRPHHDLTSEMIAAHAEQVKKAQKGNAPMPEPLPTPDDLTVILDKNNNGRDHVAKKHRFDGARFAIHELTDREEEDCAA